MAELKNIAGNSKVSIAWIDPAIKPDASKTFIKRGFMVNIETEVGGNTYTDKLYIQAMGDTDPKKAADDKTKLLDGLGIGDSVDLKYSIRGAEKSNIKKAPTLTNPSSYDGFNNLNLVSLTLVEKSKSVISDISDKQKAWDKIQLELKDKSIPHEGMKWDEAKGTWVDDLPF